MNAGTTHPRLCADDHVQTQDRVQTPLKSRLAALLRRGWRTYWERRTRRATLHILYSLDERTLRDIGISPSEIESCVYSGDCRRRRYHEAWPWRTPR